MVIRPASWILASLSLCTVVCENYASAFGQPTTKADKPAMIAVSDADRGKVVLL